MATYGWQDISKMSKVELIDKVHIFVRDQLIEILMDKDSYPPEMYEKSKKEEVEIIRQHPYLAHLPEEEKQKAYEKCDLALKRIEAIAMFQ